MSRCYSHGPVRSQRHAAYLTVTSNNQICIVLLTAKSVTYVNKCVITAIASVRHKLLLFLQYMDLFPNQSSPRV